MVPKWDLETFRPWLEARFSRSPGPGGQNVNKVSTRVTLLFDLGACSMLSNVEKARIRVRLRTRMARDGRLRVISRRERTQARNRAAAEHRLLELLIEAASAPRVRHPTRPTAGSRKRRLEVKRQRGERKQQRRAGWHE